MLRHIRTTNANVHDHRFRGTSMYANKLRPVLCGGEPTRDDQPLQGGRDILHYAAALKIANPYTGLAAELCPACVEILNNKNLP